MPTSSALNTARNSLLANLQTLKQTNPLSPATAQLALLSLIADNAGTGGGGGGGGTAGAQYEEGDVAAVAPSTGTVMLFRRADGVLKAVQGDNSDRLKVVGEMTLASGASVAVSNFPATQAVSGTISIGNFPATQPISGSVGISGSVSVGNFPATQAISATALPLPTGAATETALNNLSAKLPGALVSGRLSVDGSGVTQPVSGTVSVGNFPATQPVSGTIAVSNAFTLDATSQAIRDRLPSTLENGGLRISNNLAPSAGISGTKTIAAATTWEALTTATALRSGVEVQAGTQNTGLVFIRYVGSTDGIALTAGNSRYLPISNTNQIEVSVSVAGERVRWMGS